MSLNQPTQEAGLSRPVIQTKAGVKTIDRIDSLTGLRIFAALLVVLYHRGLVALAASSSVVARPAELGFVSVGLFYALSGFVLTVAYNRRSIDRLGFYINRIARIYPLYAIALIAAFPGFLYKWHSGEISHLQGVGALVLAPVMLQSWVPQTALKWNGPGWSLSCEAFFYLIFPLLLPIIANLKKSFLLWGCVLSCVVMLIGPIAYTYAWGPSYLPAIGGTAALAPVWMDIIAFNPLFRLPEFVAGVFLGLYAVLSERSARLGNILAGLSVLGMIITGIAAPRIPELYLHNGLLLPVWLMLIFSLYNGGALARVLSLTPLVFLGEASYAIYILQSPVSGYLGVILRPLLHSTFVGQYPTLLSLTVYVIVLVGISCMSFMFLEKPLRDRVNNRWRRR